MLNSIYLITIETKLPLPFSYFTKRAALRLFFKFPALIILALLLTFIVAIVYFLLSPEKELKPKIKAIKPAYKPTKPVYRPVKPIKRKPTVIASKEAYKKRLEEKRLKRKELLSKTIKK